MCVETTINIHKNYLHEISGVCEKYAISRSKLISLLIRIFLKEQNVTCSMFSRVRYQKRDMKKRWKIIHVSFAFDLFEKCCDVRKFYKISVSRCVAMSIDLYLDKIEEELSGKKKNMVSKSDNYEKTYSFIYNYQEGVRMFHSYWGMPEEKYVRDHLEKRESIKIE